MSPSPLVSHILLLRRPAAVFVLLAAGLLVQTAAQATGQILSRLPPRTSASLPPLPRSYALTPNISLTLHANLTLSLSRATADSAAIMWRSAASPFVRLDTLAAFTIPGSDGMYHPHSSIQCSYTAAIVAASQPAAYQALSLTLALSLVDTNATGLPKCSTPSLASTNVSLTVAATAVSSQQIVMDLRLEEASPPEAPLCANISSPIAHESDATEGACRLSIAAAHNDADAIYGLGHQYSVWDLRGRMVPVLVSEQGIGRGLEPLTALLNTFGGGAGGNWHTTYAPIPFYVTAALQAVFANASAYMEFDFRQASQAAINIYQTSLQLFVFRGAQPLDLVEQYTLHAGRQPPLPDWVLSGPIVGYYNGTDSVLALHKRFKALHINITAYWLQDWTGLRITPTGARLWWNWELDEVLYHDFGSLVANLSRDGTKIMTYINPYLAASVTKDKPNFRHDYFKEAAAQGFLIKNTSGQPYVMYSSTPDFTFGTIDLTNVQARAWYTDIIRQNMVAQQHAGWMADFGEYVPFDSVLATGQPAEVHNLFPELWAGVNREAVTDPNTSSLLPVTFFSRSGFIRSPGRSTLFWLGDQLVTWDGFDGLASTVFARMSGGLCGFSHAHSDIGGYTMVKEFGLQYTRDKELLLRWMELSAVTDLIFRSHQGNLPTDSWQVYTDNSTMICFARNAALHSLFVDYRKTLMADHVAHGYPVVRSLWMHYPNDPQAANCTTQLLLGSQFLVAPVLSPSQTQVTVYLPSGSWTHLWTGQQFSGGQSYTVNAPIGSPAIFYPSNSTIGQGVRQQLASTVEQWSCQL